jgi:hypothetical protein
LEILQQDSPASLKGKEILLRRDNMAYLPELTELPVTRSVTDTFKGYNHNLRINDNEFYDMKNMTSSLYPLLAPRGRRGIYATPESPQGMIAKDTLCYVDGSAMVIDGYRVEMGLSTEEDMCPKRLISMGAYIIVMPDKMYLNTSNITDFGNIEASFETTAPVTFTLCRIDGTDYGASDSITEPTDPIANQLWVDTSTTPNTLKQWSATSGMWVSIATTYIKIASAGIGANFEKYDGVSISGIKGETLYDNTTGNAIEDTSNLSQIDGSFVVWDKGDDYIVVIGMLDMTRTITNSITIKREMPEMDFITESENRLWGCRYGIAKNGEVVNEIYASKLGDFKNWNCFMGISTDSYAVSVGSDGQFTGAITHLGYPIFFKEKCMHKIYGNYPANYQVQTTACRGVERGSHNSLAIVNEVLYYKSTMAVCAYDGSLPTEISYQLGNTHYSDAVACAHGNKYYINMKDGKGEWHLFVYDASMGMWHKEDDIHIKAFCSCRDELYFIDGNAVKTVGGSGDSYDEETVKWMAESGVIGTSSPDKKYISQLVVRLSLTIGARVFFYIQYDSGEEWEQVCALTGHNLRSFSVPIRPKRCDHFRLRIEGEGDAKIYSITKTIEEGSEI